MISASHNPFEDNGIKVFARTGFKLPDAEEPEVEEEIFRVLPTCGGCSVPCSTGHDGATFSLTLTFCCLQFRLRLADCESYSIAATAPHRAFAPELFRKAGAEVITINNEPNGRNINLDCGALHLEGLQAKVLETGADAGVAFDGDADRCLMVAPSGRIVDGDAILLIAGRRLQTDGHMPQCGGVHRDVEPGPREGSGTA